MNLKLNNEDRSQDFLEPDPYSSAEERRQTGKYVAILVGIALVCLAIYHAWIRRIPVLASLLVPALIMLLYIAWVLYTASRDKRKEFDGERGLETVIGLLPRPQIAQTDIVQVDPPIAPKIKVEDPKTHPIKKTSILTPPQATCSNIPTAPCPPSCLVSSRVPSDNCKQENKSRGSKKTATIVLAHPPSVSKERKARKTTPADPNQIKEFRRCYSIA